MINQLNFLTAMQGFDKEIQTNAMPKIMENLVTGNTTTRKIKRRQSSRLPKKTRMKLIRTAEIRKEPEATSANEVLHPNEEDDKCHSRTNALGEGSPNEDIRDYGRVEALDSLDTDLEDQENYSDTKGPSLITPNRRSLRLKEKQVGHDYERGVVATLASRRKALLTDGKSGMNQIKLDVLNCMPDDMLLDIAHTCGVDKGRNKSEQKHNLEFVKKNRYSNTPKTIRDPREGLSQGPTHGFGEVETNTIYCLFGI